MKRQGNLDSAAKKLWTYVFIAVVVVLMIILLAGLAYVGYEIIVRKTPTPVKVAATRTKPFPTVFTATPTVTPPPSPTFTPMPTSTPTRRPTNTPAPTPTPTPTPILVDVEELGQLVTIQYKLQTVSVVEGEEAIWVERLFGENRVALVATGVVMAGVDMSLLTDEDIAVSGTTVRLIVPPAEITSVSLIPGESWVYDRQFNLLKPDWGQLLEAQKQAERTLRQWSIDNGILEQAEVVFRSRIEAFLRRLGFADVTILFRRSDERH